MTRWLLATALLLAGFVSLAQADYIIIIANLGLSKDLPDNAGEGEGGAARPGAGDRPNPEVPAPPPGGEQPKSTPVIVKAVVEVSQLGPQVLQAIGAQPPVPVALTHHLTGGPKWTTSPFLPSDTIKLVPWLAADGRPMPTVLARFQARQTELLKLGAKPSIDKILELAEWCLGHGLVSKVPDLMKEAAKIDKDHLVVAAFQKVEADLARPVNDLNAAKDWQKKLLGDNYRIAVSEHYALLHSFPAANAPAVESRLARLEDRIRSFYYWFALKKKALPVPETKLPAVLVTREDEFRRLNQVFGSIPLIADGFFAPRDRLAVFSVRRLDHAYAALLKGSEHLWASYDQDQLLKGTLKQPAVPNPPPQNPTEDDIRKLWMQFYEASTKAMILKALELDAERATVSHDGTRQLVAAAGLLPRNVAAPEWIQFGMGSFFEAAKGSPWGGVGVPSPTFNDDQNYLFQYKKTIGQDRKLDKADLLRSVITDRWFREGYAKRDGVLDLKARSTAWALTFFLAHMKLDELLLYYQELNRLPRDLEFDDEVLVACFAKAFKLQDEKRPGKVDARKFAALAAEWHDYVNRTPLEADEMLRQINKNEGELRGKP